MACGAEYEPKIISALVDAMIRLMCRPHQLSDHLARQAYPNSMFVGYDYHQASIEAARRRAADAGVADAGVAERVRFEVAAATEYPGTYDVAAFFDCLHDMGDPVAAARHVRESLAPDGTWMVFEPAASDRVEDNLNPVGRLYYAVSTMVCTPASLAQDGRMALGAQAGPARLGEILRVAGFQQGPRSRPHSVQHRAGSPAVADAATRPLWLVFYRGR